MERNINSPDSPSLFTPASVSGFKPSFRSVELRLSSPFSGLKENDLAGISSSQTTRLEGLPHSSQAAFPSTESHDSVDASAGAITAAAAKIVSSGAAFTDLYGFGTTLAFY